MGEGKGKEITCNGFCGLGEGCGSEKVTRVTVSGVWEDKGKCVTCNGFCGLGGGWGREKVSRVTVSEVWEGCSLLDTIFNLPCERHDPRKTAILKPSKLTPYRPAKSADM